MYRLTAQVIIKSDITYRASGTTGLHDLVISPLSTCSAGLLTLACKNVVLLMRVISSEITPIIQAL